MKINSKYYASMGHVPLGCWQLWLSTIYCPLQLLITCLFVISLKPCSTIHSLKTVGQVACCFPLTNLSCEYQIYQAVFPCNVPQKSDGITFLKSPSLSIVFIWYNMLNIFKMISTLTQLFCSRSHTVSENMGSHFHLNQHAYFFKLNNSHQYNS